VRVAYDGSETVTSDALVLALCDSPPAEAAATTLSSSPSVLTETISAGCVLAEILMAGGGGS
jgi:hypothetical protein